MSQGSSSILAVGSTATDLAKASNIAITHEPLQHSLATSSEGSSPSPVALKTRKKSTVYEDRNYVAEKSDEEEIDMEETYSIPENERATVLFDFDRERAKRLAGAVNIPKEMYTEKEKALFLQLAMRGFEPLAPKHWQFDFPTLPDSLFPEAGKKKSDPIIKISRSTTFNGKLPDTLL
jgi:hypothetical protein